MAQRLLYWGFDIKRLLGDFKKFYGNHTEALSKYDTLLTPLPPKKGKKKNNLKNPPCFDLVYPFFLFCETFVHISAVCYYCDVNTHCKCHRCGRICSPFTHTQYCHYYRTWCSRILTLGIQDLQVDLVGGSATRRLTGFVSLWSHGRRVWTSIGYRHVNTVSLFPSGWWTWVPRGVLKFSQ